MWGLVRRLAAPVVVATLTGAAGAYAAAHTTPVQVLNTSDGTDDALQPAPETSEDPGEVEVDPADDAGEVEPGDDTGEPEPTKGPERSTTGCPDGFSGNHGKFVSSSEEHPRSEAAHSPCGKPLQAVHDDDIPDDEVPVDEAPVAERTADDPDDGAVSAERSGGHGQGQGHGRGHGHKAAVGDN